MRKQIQNISLLIVVTLLWIATANVDAQTYKILPLGNSITEGYDGTAPPIPQRIAYRNQLYNDLTAAAYNFDYVGHKNTGYAILPDADHGGIPGTQDQYIVKLLQDGYDELNNIQITTGSQPYLDVYPADIILLHIGTNDLLNGEGSDAASVGNILDEIDAWEISSGNHVTVFVARIVNRTPYHLETTEFNDNVATLVADRGDPSVIMVDIEDGAGIDYATEMMADGFHPAQSAYDKMGQTWFTALDAYLTATPDAPTNLSLTGETSSSILLSWNDNSSNESGYEIERSLTGSGGDFTLIYTTSVNANSYTSSGLEDETQYYYRVRAINATGPSLYSTIENTTTLLAAPTAPSGLSTGAVDAASIELSWTDNSDNETGFQVERALALGGPYTLIQTSGANTTNYTSSGLEDNTQYYFRVRATNSAGESGYTNIVNATTDLAPPLAPTLLGTGVVSTSSIALSWTDNSDNESGFQIERSVNAGFGFTLINTTAVNATAYVNNGLIENTTYYYRVRAINATGNSTYSNVASATTLLSLPDAPGGLALDQITISSMRLTWSDNSDNESGFEIRRALVSGGPYTLIQTTSANTTSYSNIGLDDNTRYYYQVNSINATGASGYTSANATTLLAIPDAPGGLALSSITTSSIRLTWTDNSDSETGFIIERSLSASSGYSVIQTNPANVNTFIDTGLDDDTRYYYRVMATNATGNSAYSNVANATTLLAAPDSPDNLMLSDITISSIHLTWGDNSDNETAFQIERSLNEFSGYSLIHTTAPNISSYTNIGLDDNTQFYFRVRAVNAAGASAYTNVASAFTQMSVPSTPSGIQLSDITHNSIRISWTDNSDNENGFEIERSPISGFGFVLIQTTAAGVTSYTNTGLDGDTEYFYRVRAINAAGSSGYTSEASASTLLLAPEAPSNVLISNITTSSMDLDWTDNSDNETSFEIERSLSPFAGFVLIRTTLADVTSYSDTGLDDDTQYYYRIRAVNATGPSAYSAMVNGTTQLAIPVDPSGLDGAATSTCTIDLRWLDNSDNEEGFEIERSLSPVGGFSVIQVLAPDQVSFTDTNTENNTTYYYKVRAFNAADYSNYTSIVTVNVLVVLHGGTIAADQTICPSGDPALLTNVLSPSGGSGTWIYQWQSRIIPGVYADISGANGLIYDPPAGMIQATEYQRVSTTECGIVASNVVNITVEDLEVPVFTVCPLDIIAAIERNESSGPVLTPDPVVTDNCELVLQTWSLSGATVAVSPSTGINILGEYIFNLGITTVSYLVEDISGNQATCSFTVSVSKKIPEVINISIPDASMRIGDVISATITVSNDGGTPYTLISGAIGAYPLYNPQPFFHRSNDTTYLANINILEGGNSYLALEDIPVTNLIVSDGVNNSLPYSFPIVQSNDPLDAALPVINFMSVLPGDKKIGDVVLLNINADGLNYSIHPSSMISGILVTEPNIVFTEVGGGNYTLAYTVMEGDADVVPGSFTSHIILVKPSGNENLPYSVVGGTTSLTIDAHPPVINQLEVSDIEVGVGGIVQVTITAAEEGFTAGPGTVVNGVPLSSSRLTFSEHAGGLYELSYVVADVDNNVAPGALVMSLVMVDPSGNMSEPYSDLTTNSLEIYTELPTAILAGTPEVCEGELADLSVFLNGRSPWIVELSDGSTSTTYSDITTSDYTIQVSPSVTTTYRITSVIDVNGVVNSGGNSITVSVNQATDVEIINLSKAYSVEADPIKLEADISGGTFSGPGVISATGYFYPGVADTIDSPHTIIYTYLNPNGCNSVDSAQVFVLGAEGAIFIPVYNVCANGDPFTITASNIADVIGSFTLQDEAGGIVSTGFTDQGDNTAEIVPGLLSQGVYTVEYKYLDGVVLYLRENFEIVSTAEPIILNLDKAIYCQNETPFKLEANISSVIFEGPGVTGEVADGYIFNPHETVPGQITITCTNVSGAGCSASTEKDLSILFAPDVDFSISDACVAEDGGVVSFNNLTDEKLLVESWSWNFGDPGSGSDNYSDLIDAEHSYTESGRKQISLTATTFEGCVASSIMDTLIGSQPMVDFTWLSDCYTDGSGIAFINRTVSGATELDTLVWTFWTGDGGFLDKIGTDPGNDTILYSFDAAENFEVQLYARNSSGCFDTIVKEITLQSTIVLGAEEYKENFNTDEGLWTIRSEDQVESWTWDQPDFDGYEQVSGDRAWFTQLPRDEVGYMEHSWIQSPCFDFTESKRPLIKLDIMKSFYPSLSGAVLQYQDVIEEGWKTIGESTPGIEWYNVSNIDYQPGGSNIGWGLNVFDVDQEWVTAVHDLDQLKGNKNVSFRVVIATDGGHSIGNQGFAFDNVLIGERTKLAVLEHFTNSSDETSFSADSIIDDFAATHSNDVVDIQYHMSYPGVDQMNLNNPDPASTRSFYYGIPQVPYAILEGGINSYYRYDFSDLKTAPVLNHIRQASLEIPLFEIDLDVDWLEGSADISTTVTCNTAQYEENIQLYLVVIETSVTAYTGLNGDTDFSNVVLDMVPTAAGKLLGDNWYEGKSDMRTNSWTYQDYVEDVNDLAVVAFVQDRNTGKILQAEINYADKTVGIPSQVYELDQLVTYPNPAKNSFFVNLGEPSQQETRYELMDMSGKILISKRVPAGYQIYEIDIHHLNRGIYMLRWYESDQIKGINKIIKTE